MTQAKKGEEKKQCLFYVIGVPSWTASNYISNVNIVETSYYYTEWIKSILVNRLSTN